MDILPPPQRTGIFFLHNPKAGGTSIRSLLETLYAASERAPVFCNAPIDAARCEARIEEFQGYRFYSGHFGYAQFEALGAGHALITNFRNPVSRILSLYNYWLNNVPEEHLSGLAPEDAGVVLEAKRHSFSEFIRSDNPYLQLYLHDAHFRQLYKSNWSMDFGPQSAMWTVLRRIDGLRWFNISEFADLSLLFFRKAFPEYSGREMPVTNISRRSETRVSEADVDHIVSINRRDLQIYAFAVQRLMREATQN